MAGKKLQSAKKKKMINNTIVHIVLAVLAIIWLFPIAWVILTSFRAEKGSYVSTFFPKAFTLDNYIKLFTDTSILNFPQMFMNTLFIAICSCILSAFYVLAVSYCLSRLKFKMRKPYMNMAMILGLFPGFMSMIAVYFILKAMGLTEGNLIKLALILCIPVVQDWVSRLQKDSLIRFRLQLMKLHFWTDVPDGRFSARSHCHLVNRSLYIQC